MTPTKTDRQHRLILSLETICRLLKWDSFGVNNIKPESIDSVCLCGDTLQFRTVDKRMIPLSVHQVLEYAQNLASIQAPIVVEWERASEMQWGREQGYACNLINGNTYNLINGNCYRFFVYCKSNSDIRVDCLDPGSQYRGKSKHSSAVKLAFQGKGVALSDDLWDNLKQALLGKSSS